MMTSISVTMTMSIMYSSLMMVFSKTPMKMMSFLSLMAISVNIFAMNLLGQSWYPTIYMLIYLGGIIVLISIISSIMPNQNSKKKKFKIWMVMVMLGVLACQNNFDSGSPMLTKVSFSGTNSTMMALTMMILYFFMFLTIISTESGSLRSEACCKMK